MTTLGSEGTGVNDHFWCSARTQFSGALLRGDGGKRGPALLDVLAAAVRALHLAFFVIHERQNLVEELIAGTAEEFVVGHTDLHSAEGSRQNSRPLGRRFQHGVRSRILRALGLGFLRRSGSRILRGSASWNWRKLRTKEVQGTVRCSAKGGLSPCHNHPIVLCR